jgi:hypothetical protein
MRAFGAKSKPVYAQSVKVLPAPLDEERAFIPYGR